MCLDFQHGQDFHATRVTEATDWADTINSDVVIITAGVRQRENESRRDLMGRNKAIMVRETARSLSPCGCPLALGARAWLADCRAWPSPCLVPRPATAPSAARPAVPRLTLHRLTFSILAPRPAGAHRPAHG